MFVERQSIFMEHRFGSRHRVFPGLRPGAKLGPSLLDTLYGKLFLSEHRGENQGASRRQAGRKKGTISGPDLDPPREAGEKRRLAPTIHGYIILRMKSKPPIRFFLDSSNFPALQRFDNQACFWTYVHGRWKDEWVNGWMSEWVRNGMNGWISELVNR